MTTDFVIDFSKVNFSYNGVSVLKAATFQIAAHEALCIVGPNGGGKTTLLRLILGLIRPQSGTIQVLGQSPEQVQHLLGYVPQSLQYDPLFPARVRDIVLMGRLSKKRLHPSREDHKLADKAMADMNIAALANSPFAELSGGQRQRALIARALATQPKILLLDEPTANIDLAHEVKLFEQLCELRQRMTLLMVTHNIGLAPALVDKVLCVHNYVDLHPTEELTEVEINTSYGQQALRWIRHDQCVSDSGTPHPHTHD